MYRGNGFSQAAGQGSQSQNYQGHGRGSRGFRGGRGRGRGGQGWRNGQGNNRGAVSMESLSLRSNFGDWGSGSRRHNANDREQRSSDDRENWRHNSSDRNRQGQNSGDQSTRRPYFAPRGGAGGNTAHHDRQHPEGNEQNPPKYRKQRKCPISLNDLDRLATQQPDVVVLELLNERSGFFVLTEVSDIRPKQVDKALMVLARATTSQALMDSVYELLNKSCSKTFVATLMNYSFTLKRQFPEKGPIFFAHLHTILETFCNGMINTAIHRLINLVDSCHFTLTALEVEGHVEEYLVNKYKLLLERLNEATKKWHQEKDMNKQDIRQRREAEMDNLEPPDDFREISVLPTPLDIMDTKRPFLRRNMVQGRYVDSQHYLDVQFRLLREDFVRPLREGINQFRSNTKGRLMDIRVYRNVTYIGSRLERLKLFHEVRIGNMKSARLENSRRLMYGNLVCFSSDNFASMILGSVADRNADRLKDGVIGVDFDTDISEHDMSRPFVMVESRAYFMAYKHVLQALKEMPNQVPMEMYVVEVEPLIDPPQYLNVAAGEVYDLRIMRNKTLMKRSEALNNFFMHKEAEEEQQHGEEIGYKEMRLRNVVITDDLAFWPSENTLGLDSSQRRALYSALNHELAIIQGPPGTGKTFIGLKIVQTLLHNSDVWKDKDNPTPILVVCFTNHALDQFLEGMTSFTSSIVRVGSRTKSENIDRFQINRLVKSVVQTRSMPHSIHSQKVDISNDLRRLELAIGLCRQIDQECKAPRGIFSLDVFEKNIIPAHILQQLHSVEYSNKLTHWLSMNFQPGSAGQQSAVSAAKGQGALPQEARSKPENEMDKDEEERKDNEEFIGLEERDRMIDDDWEESVPNVKINPVKFEVLIDELECEVNSLMSQEQDERTYLEIMIRSGLLEAIKYGLTLPVNRREVEILQAQTQLNIWKLEPQERWQLYNHWVAQLQRQVRPTWLSMTAEFQKRVKTLEATKNAEYLYAMRRAAVVGMTTTGAAQYNKILQDLAPAIVVIEEAAEILESHVISSLTAECKHLIMIGDHQQLQPSATVYELATKYGLETSLFERLIKNGLAYETLEYQHRMRPSISRLLVPSIYPSLKDHPSVNEYPSVLGLTHDVFFIAHNQMERKECDDNSSHENQYEAELLIGLCRHLLLQGYDPADITILTAYSGQFFLLRRLQRQDPVCDGVQVCVVDNYQGEENKIILLSLVRSNPEGKVGFLRTDNRVCVALSRAKHGLYITGNMDLLSQSSDLWKKVKADLAQSDGIGEALPLRCENHPHQITLVSSGQDFLTKSPEGGCTLVCDRQLPNCRHPCPQVCHIADPDHHNYRCRVPCPKVLCRLDHKCPKQCWQECGPCMVIRTKLLPCGHSHKIPCHVSRASYKCPTQVEKVIPACQHQVTMPCHQDPALFTCPEDCDTRVDCGHKCKNKCHRTKDPDHKLYLCMEPCARINAGCSQKHPCLKKCYVECGPCMEKVKKMLPCRHEAKEVECSQPAEEVQCNQKCRKILPCGHHCKRLCYNECGGCEVLVRKEVPTCGHTIHIACRKPATSGECDGPCPKKLLCGHGCQQKCKEKCTTNCPALVITNERCPRNHVIQLPCHLKSKVQGETAWEHCSEPCGQTLSCGHQCVGTCGQCLHGRLHKACNEQCDRALVCGHTCKYPCGKSCPPCQEECCWKCTHSKCRNKCGVPCNPCLEKCEWGCQHVRCGKKCGEKCGRKPCDQPCSKKLKCGHDCTGFCGDPCPPLCRVCDLEELTEFFLLGNEDDPEARFVWLEDCGHCIEAEGLEMWLTKESGEIGMKACPRCRNAIYNNKRHQHLILQAYEGVQAIKKKYYSIHSTIKKKDIELFLQDPEVIDRYKSQVLKILKKMGSEAKRGNPFNKLSEDEKSLCHFQAQVLKKAADIAKQARGSTSSPAHKLQAVLGKVDGLVAQVMEKTTTISDQMKEEVTCELQRLAILPAYCTFLEKTTSYQNSSIMRLKAELGKLMNPTEKYNQKRDDKVRALLKESEKYVGGLGINDNERLMILKAMNLRNGHWYKCPNGHVYCITECGGAMMESTCPECGSRIGGGSHTLRSDNAVATEMDGARHSAWSEQNNMANFVLDD
ncbi:NFX1-type zinc finger-containing protein 1-like [Portunus trituberculatus]|uniref:NFX1-type zinc finger-containing protein 1-like n=1 Tax=Portunus trituberculatus TaxID=210409 RepID=UPI001E1D21DC|nr:NFX1-type zinc finger-containing protein 1-like [Portunus trituberculatus]XP_045127075.1 NFX1-type zinc finger-containing protein 1-like [Portunus trituberculatus]XP_045127076.1 NFX1-type zinc finger-containing protein 1-like [Portunus trituberculatus]XP_045127077.1 NFX1-type zinc finger-containing protein 1-like [Portunus trituberculatus]XP_045127078.1 NFX1-type zinc finger-containing protein 1-like [Portunus trituberculatus]